MTPTFEVRILLETDADAIFTFARARMEAADAMEAEMASWTARWRAESLAHYLPQGWSFGAFSADGQLRGFLLGQPLLFFRGLTQTLWIEEFEYDDVEVARALLDVAYRWARDKHLQCVLLEAAPDQELLLGNWKNVHANGAPLVEIRSAKF